MNYKEIFKTFILSACTVMMAGCSSTVILESERFMSAFRKDVPFALDSLTQIGEGKFFHDERFLDFLADLQVAVDVVAGVLTRALHVFPERVFLGPAPVVRPQVDVAIVDVGIIA